VARKQTSVANASPEELGAASEGQAAQMEAAHRVGAYGPDAWPVNWNGLIIGMLGSVAALVVVGLSGVALKAHDVASDGVINDWHKVPFWTLAYTVFGTFLAFALGGWIAGQIAGFRRAEPCMLHGACAWLLTLPVLALLGAVGAGSMFGGWLGGLSNGHPGWSQRGNAVELRAASPTLDPNRATGVVTASDGRALADEDAARAARNTALATVASLLIGLMGAVVGGWLSSGEPMTISYYRTSGVPATSA
jgi:hypothetical protein